MYYAPRSAKRTIILGVDVFLALLALYAALALRFGDPLFVTAAPKEYAALFGATMFVTLGVLILLRVPWIKLTAVEGLANLRIAAASVVLGLSLIAVGFLLQALPPRSVPFIFSAVFFAVVVLVRVLAMQLISFAKLQDASADKVAVYGAGSAGIQLAAALRQARELSPVFFVDDDPKLHGVIVAGMPVFAPKVLSEKLARHHINQVLLAMP